MTKTFFNSRAGHWDEMVAEKDANKLKTMAERLDIKPGSSVLDVGTGTGVFVPYILESIGEKGRLVCLDFAEEMLEKAKAKDSRETSGMSVPISSGVTLPMSVLMPSSVIPVSLISRTNRRP